MMCWFLLHQIIAMTSLPPSSFAQLSQGGHVDLRSRRIWQNANHHLSSVINDKDEDRKNRSFTIIARIMAFGIRHADAERSDEQHNMDGTKSFLPLNEDSNDSEEEQVKDVQQNILLTLMIRMLFERLAQQANDTRKLSAVRMEPFQ